MSKWIDKEKGPECFCGMPTSVHVDSEDKAWLMCIFHSYAEGVMFPLPKDGRPDNWANVSREELNVIMEQGDKEDDAREE